MASDSSFVINSSMKLLFISRLIWKRIKNSENSYYISYIDIIIPISSKYNIFDIRIFSLVSGFTKKFSVTSLTSAIMAAIILRDL